jgi:hypothetical protein
MRQVFLGGSGLVVSELAMGTQSTPLEETFRAFDDLVRSGKVRYIGVSNFTTYQLVQALCLARARGWSAPVCLQAEYSLLPAAGSPASTTRGRRRRTPAAASAAGTGGTTCRRSGKTRGPGPS